MNAPEESPETDVWLRSTWSIAEAGVVDPPSTLVDPDDMEPMELGVTGMPAPVDPSVPGPPSAPLDRAPLAASLVESGAPEEPHPTRALSESRLARGTAERSESIGESFRAVGAIAS
jgi:hypothetical protein